MNMGIWGLQETGKLWDCSLRQAAQVVHIHGGELAG